MRVTTYSQMSRAIDVLQRNQQSVVDAQEKLAAGKKVLRASDDPTAAARIERALARQGRAEASQRALEASRNTMVQAETALGDANGLLQEARDLIVQAGNPTLGDGERRSLANAIRGIRNQLLQVANRDDGAGGMLFGGQGSSVPPFVDAPGGVQFRGTAGELRAASGEPLPLSADGGAAFLRATTGNGVFVTEPDPGNANGAWIDAGRVTDPAAVTGDPYSVYFTVDAAGTRFDILRNGLPTGVSGPYVAGQDIVFDGMAVRVTGVPTDGDRFELTPSAPELSVFDVLDLAVVELQAAGRSDAQRAQTVARSLRDIDSSMATLVGERARLGEVLNRTDAVEGRIADGKLLAQTERSAAEDIDMVQAVSDFSQKQTSYDAALKAYSMVQRLSLFEYIR